MTSFLDWLTELLPPVVPPLILQGRLERRPQSHPRG